MYSTKFLNILLLYPTLITEFIRLNNKKQLDNFENFENCNIIRLLKEFNLEELNYAICFYKFK